MGDKLYFFSKLPPLFLKSYSLFLYHAELITEGLAN